jgi:hypothetical protein
MSIWLRNVYAALVAAAVKRVVSKDDDRGERMFCDRRSKSKEVLQMNGRDAAHMTPVLGGCPLADGSFPPFFSIT